MIKSDDSSSGQDRAGSRPEKCWHREPTATQIRLETADNGIFLFPLQQRMFAHLATSDGADVLTLGFPSHEVSISGTRLHPILSALQDSAVEWIKPLPPRHATLTADGSAAVTGIEVKAAESNR
jgi:hypothetical protein